MEKRKMEFSDFAERLEKSLKGKSKNATAKIAGLSEGILRKYLEGTTAPSIYKAKRLAHALGVNYLWLSIGEGAMVDLDSEFNFETIEKPDEDHILKNKSNTCKNIEPEKTRVSNFDLEEFGGVAAMMVDMLKKEKLLTNIEPEQFKKILVILCKMAIKNKDFDKTNVIEIIDLLK